MVSNLLRPGFYAFDRPVLAITSSPLFAILSGFRDYYISICFIYVYSYLFWILGGVKLDYNFTVTGYMPAHLYDFPHAAASGGFSDDSRHPASDCTGLASQMWNHGSISIHW